jgi:hypothetical protein
MFLAQFLEKILDTRFDLANGFASRELDMSRLGTPSLIQV